MSQPDLAERFDALARDLSGVVDDALEARAADRIGNERLGQVMASLGRLYAEKVQNGEPAQPFGMNSRMTVTDVAIVCTAMMHAVGLEVFELGGWQTMSGLGRLNEAHGRTKPEGG